MKIGFDASRAFAQNRTGTENYSYQLLTHLAKIDTENYYLVYIRPGHEMPKESWPSNFKFQILNFKFLWTQFGLAKQTFKDKLDVLFVPAHTLPLIHRPGLKTVVTVHDLGAEYLPSHHQLKQRLYLNLITHHQLKSATRLIAVSKATKADLIKKVGIAKEKISVIYEGYNKQLFHPITGQKLYQTLQNYNLQPHSYYLFVGTIQPRKNLERLIKAYADFIKKFNYPTSIPQLVLAGSKGWLADEIYALPKKLGIEDKIQFLGYVPDEKLPALYSGAIAFLYPSLFEGFGLPILEAMACGCPVLTSNLGSMREISSEKLGKTQKPDKSNDQIIRNSENLILRKPGTLSSSESFRSAALLVNPYSAAEITNGISPLTTNYELRTTLIKLGQEQVQKFSWENCARQTIQVLRKVATNL